MLVATKLQLDFLKCSITGEIFLDPVIADDGHCYEREALEDWLKINRESPSSIKKQKQN